jgi:hypothetical protein
LLVPDVMTIFFLSQNVSFVSQFSVSLCVRVDICRSLSDIFGAGSPVQFFTMASAPLPVAPAAAVGSCDGSELVSHHLGVGGPTAAHLQERHIRLLRRQIDVTDAALNLERARSDKHAEALVHIART